MLDLLTYENRLVMRVCLHTGLRVGDVLQLRPQQLKPNFWVTEQKTGKRRQIGLPEPLLSDLRDSADAEWVFPGQRPGKHRTRQAVWKDVKRAAAAARLTVNAAPHSARKVYAVQLLKDYGDIDRVAPSFCSFFIISLFCWRIEKERFFFINYYCSNN